MRPPIFRGIILKGKIKLDNSPRFLEYLSSFEGKRIELVLRERQVGRSNELNKYYWAVPVAMLSDELGYEPDEMHTALKEKFKVDSTAKLKTEEFQEYIKKVVRWAAQDLNVNIPDPNNVEY